MKKIFIDANIYLNFFNGNKPELKKLLNSLLEIKDSIFISSQIVNEVNRNKLNIANNSLMEHFKNFKALSENINKVNLPEHLERETKSLQSWNSKSNNMKDTHKDLQKDLEALIHKTLNEIMHSVDPVSSTFNLLFQGALEASEHEIKAARFRRELGNPPGKYDDPLGDQISWEQFLNCSSGSEHIWIITADLDYFTDCKAYSNKKIYLNPFLHNELVKVNTATANPSIYCFKTLAEGLKHFNQYSSEKINKLPTEEELKAIAEEELSDSTFQIYEQGELKYMYLPPGFTSPNHYLHYLRVVDAEDMQ